MCSVNNEDVFNYDNEFGKEVDALVAIMKLSSLFKLRFNVLGTISFKESRRVTFCLWLERWTSGRWTPPRTQSTSKYEY